MHSCDNTNNSLKFTSQLRQHSEDMKHSKPILEAKLGEHTLLTPDIFAP